jgi:DNA repair exonuclease SbcCD ATPase subunit
MVPFQGTGTPENQGGNGEPFMIKKLKLHSFGKFSGKTFAFKPVTIFLGDNESGKSTIFDALFDNICGPGKNISGGRRLSLRYGDDRASELETDGEELNIDTDEFLNLYAIHAGDISLNFSSGKNWMDKVKSSIFTGGIDPSKIAGEFEVLSRDKGNYSHVKKYKKKTEELAGLEKDLDELKQEKEKILGSENDVKKKEKELNDLYKLIGEKESELNGYHDELDQQTRIREREALLGTIRLVDGYKELKASIHEMERFSKDRSVELTGYLDKIDDFEKKRSGLDSSIKLMNEDISNKEKRMGELQSIINKARIKSDIASQLLRKIERDRPQPEIKLKTVWNKVLLALSPLALVAGIAAFFVLPFFIVDRAQFMWVRITAAAFGFVVSLIMFLRARKKVVAQGTADVSDFITGIKDEWRTRVVGEELKSDGIDGIVRELIKHQGELEVMGREKQKLLGEVNDERNRKKREEEKMLSCNEELEVKAREFDGFLKSLGIKDRDEYIRKRNEYEHTKEELDNKEEELKKAITHYQAGDADTLRIECETRAKKLMDQIRVSKKSDAEINGIVKLEKETDTTLSELRARMNDLKTSVDEGKGMVRGSLGNLPEQIREKEAAIVSCRREINRMEIDRKAAAIASEIFFDIAKDSGMVLAELGREISVMFGDILPEVRDITIRDFKTDDISVTDAGGEKRELEYVSTGTHDAFLLAARLALALRSSGGEWPGIMILDEPFHALDEGRKLKALKLLKKFHDTYGWQVVLFSKDVHIAAKMKEILTDAVVHELKVGE